MSRAARRSGCLLRLCAGALLLAPLNPPAARAETTPPRGAVDGRIRSVRYSAEDVFRLRGFVGYQIDLQFAPDERFVGLGAGDIEGIAYAAEGNHLFLKPKAVRVTTNLTVLTDRRQYQFDYAATAQRPSADDPDVIYALRFVYPPETVREAKEDAARRIESQLDRAAGERPRNLDYWFCGPPDLQPVAASDDGVHTRLRFSVNAELPAIFVRNEDDSESLVNFNVEAGEIVLHRLARRFVLRRGRASGCIVNRGFSGSGARLDSGTVTPRVERRVQEVGP